MTIVRKLALVLAIVTGIPAAHAGSIPGMRGHDHTGITVPDIEQAITFFRDIMGCELATSFGPFADDKGTFMKDLLNVHERATIKQISLMRCGFGSNIELFQYTSPDQRAEVPKNSDIGGHHIAFYVDDIDAAAKYLKDNNIRTMMGPFPVNEGPAAGQVILYFLTPWGLQLELITYPKGMAYEKDGKVILWSPKDPGK